ncbi:isochorismatase family protein [Clostridium senegalense]|uniref:isochorismatase family protein n=1 Tax=Clostridium senegalense TaxID=1465809 RepID=UPI001C10A234|nr:isochorismatase family protein [Clostridium senegalense]MBU5225435.1 isochorismatase family protein [Clostridium senegalense]
MRALIVVDMQKHILSQKNFKEEKEKIKEIINICKAKGDKIIFTKHEDQDDESPFNKNCDRGNIHEEFVDYYDELVIKTTPSAFFKTNLEEILKKNNINEVIIVGFNTEFCCMFTAIAAFDRGYTVTFIEDATGTVNSSETYDMEDLDIKDLVGSVLNWSGKIDVLYLNEFLELENVK